MQDRTEIDGSVHRQFLEGYCVKDLNKKLIRAHKTAIRNPRTVSVTQRKIGRNELCPCGSGRKFKKCCIVKANKGEEILAIS